MPVPLPPFVSTLPGTLVYDFMQRILVLDGWAAYAVVGLLCFGESAFLLGFVVPGETAVILGGVMASQQNVELRTMLIVSIICAILGDTVGYEMGKHFGPRILDLKVMRKRQHLIEFSRHFQRRRGMAGVFLGRWTALLRALVPGMAGMAGMNYRQFLMANAASGTLWATTYTLLGYFIGESIERITGPASAALAILFVVAYITLVVRARIIERRLTRAETGRRD